MAGASNVGPSQSASSSGGSGQVGQISLFVPGQPEAQMRARQESLDRMEAAVTELRGMVASNLPALSDEDILIMVGEQLNDLDANIRGKLAGMKQNAARGRMLSGALTALNEQVSAAGGNQNAPIDRNATFKYIDEGGAERTTTLGAVLDRYGLNPGDKLSEENVRKLRDGIERRAGDIRSEGETSQIELQQVMSRRSQLLQITSNVMASRNDSRKAIAQNIRG
ncbi:MAG: hypothetical protein U0269_19240 [Polyangiales bacterium]